MHQLLLIFHMLICLALLVLVLVQHGKGADAGALSGGSGSAHSVFGSQGSTSFLVKVTTLLAIAFFATSLSLGLFAPGKKSSHANSLSAQVLDQPGGKSH